MVNNRQGDLHPWSSIIPPCHSGWFIGENQAASFTLKLASVHSSAHTGAKYRLQIYDSRYVVCKESYKCTPSYWRLLIASNRIWFDIPYYKYKNSIKKRRTLSNDLTVTSRFLSTLIEMCHDWSLKLNYSHPFDWMLIGKQNISRRT